MAETKAEADSGTSRIRKLDGGKYAVSLPSRGITVVAKDKTQARILDNAEAIIETSRKRLSA